jgi:hypothetical protein
LQQTRLGAGQGAPKRKPGLGLQAMKGRLQKDFSSRLAKPGALQGPLGR